MRSGKRSSEKLETRTWVGVHSAVASEAAWGVVVVGGEVAE